MSNLAQVLRDVENLRQKIAAQGAIPAETLRRIEYKFRLECNYHSNRIEGGTLTKLETRSVMVGNITVKDKPLQDIREMRGHDEAMQQILRVGRGEATLSERRIKDFHRAILAPEKMEEAAAVGQWKQTGNHILNYQGERFDFTRPAEVPQAIHDLLNWLNAGLEQIERKSPKAPDPLLLCFEFHLRYLTIHPFDDGNGRTARLLTNLVLVALGYPPFWVSEGAEKDAYNRYLADVQAYGGSPDLLFEFLAGLLLRSLQLVSDALEGKPIADVDDWKKKVTLLKGSLPQEDKIRVARSKAAIEDVYARSIQPTIARVVEELEVYDELFLEKEVKGGIGDYSVDLTEKNILGMQFNFLDRTQTLHFSYRLLSFKKQAAAPFHINCSLLWLFGNYGYGLLFDQPDEQPFLSKPYDAYYDATEIAEIVQRCGEAMLEQLEQHLND